MSGTISLAEEIQNAIWFGYGAAAEIIGLPFGLYRPVDATAAIVSGNLIDTLPATFSPDNYAYRKPSGYGKPTWTVLVDGRITQPGDYLVEVTPLPGQAARTFFVGDMQPTLPIIAIECNAVASFARPGSSSAVGEITSYGGEDVASEVVLATGWPCSRLTKSRGEKSDANLPGDVKTPWFEFLVPAIPGTEILYDDIIHCADGQRFLISSAELSSLGWRILAMLADA